MNERWKVKTAIKFRRDAHVGIKVNLSANLTINSLKDI